MNNLKYKPLVGYSLTLTIAFLAGCGEDRGYEGDQRAAIKGEVTYEGEPVTGAITLFTAEGSGRSVSSTILDGEYEFKEASGPTFGTYKVQIESFVFEGEGDSKTKKQTLPAKFNKETTLELKVDKALMEEQNFTLTESGGS